MHEPRFNLKEEVSCPIVSNSDIFFIKKKEKEKKSVLTDSNLNIQLVFPFTRIRAHQAPARLEDIHKLLDIRIHRQATGAANPVSGNPDADRLVPVARDAGE